jgi:hypothetical protein
MDNDQPESARACTRPLVQENTENSRAAEVLQERLRFEQLLSNLSARFVNLAPDQIDREIQHALGQILEFFGVDRCGLVRISPEETSWRVTHVAYASEVSPVPEKTDLPATMFPWVYEKLPSGMRSSLSGHVMNCRMKPPSTSKHTRDWKFDPV